MKHAAELHHGQATVDIAVRDDIESAVVIWRDLGGQLHIRLIGDPAAVKQLLDDAEGTLDW